MAAGWGSFAHTDRRPAVWMQRCTRRQHESNNGDDDCKNGIHIRIPRAGLTHAQSVCREDGSHDKARKTEITLCMCLPVHANMHHHPPVPVLPPTNRCSMAVLDGRSIQRRQVKHHPSPMPSWPPHTVARRESRPSGRQHETSKCRLLDLLAHTHVMLVSV
jgi:hypothetical protein